VRTRIAAAAILIGCCAAVRAQEPVPTPAPTAAPGPRVDLTAVNPPEAPAPLPLGPDQIAPVHNARAPAKPETDFIAAPIPISSPTLGTGLAAVAAILFPISRDDKVSPPTTLGVGGLYTDNHSWAFGAAARLYISEDHWRLLSGVARGEFHYDLTLPPDFSGGGVAVPIRQTVTGLTAELLRRVSSVLFVGARYTYAKTAIGLNAEDEDSEAAPPPRDRDVKLAALGLRIQTDSRDSTFYPRRGKLFDLNADFYEPAFGGTRTYQSYKAFFNAFLSTGERGVLGVRGSLCDVRGDAPVYALCLFGMQGDLRGYEVGRYIDRTMWSAQAEYRWRLPESLGSFFARFGLVAFAGVGEVAPSFSDLSSHDLLPGGGVGIRYLLSRQNPINFRIDYAWGKAGNKGVHVGVGEAF
jgi:outer membrane translocation and assembly module TamA